MLKNWHEAASERYGGGCSWKGTTCDIGEVQDLRQALEHEEQIQLEDQELREKGNEA